MQKQLGDLGNERVRALLNIILTDTILFFQVGKMMGPDQVIETVGFILEDFKHLKPEDFVLCFNKAKKGHYGQLFDRLDGQIMLSWLTTYDNERTAIVESVHARENRQIKQSTTAVIGQPDNPDEVFARNIAKLKERLENNKRLRMAQQEQSKPADNYNAAYVKHQHWLAKFDKVHATKPMDAKGGRFIYRYGRVLDVNAFLEHKQWQYNEFVIKGRKPYEVK